MKANQIAIVEITQWGSDKGLFVDGQLILSADQIEGDSYQDLEDVAEALANAAGVRVTRIDHWEKNDEEWQWGDIEKCLKRRGLLHCDENEQGG